MASEDVVVVTVQDTTDAWNPVTGGGRVGVFLVHQHSQNLPSRVGL